MLKQYKNIHTLLEIPCLQPPHPTVRQHATTASCSVRLCDIGSHSDCSILPIHQQGGRKGQSKEPKVLHSIRLYALALERPHLARLPNDTLAFL
jgi:hypothetical protein